MNLNLNLKLSLVCLAGGHDRVIKTGSGFTYDGWHGRARTGDAAVVTESSNSSSYSSTYGLPGSASSSEMPSSTSPHPSPYPRSLSVPARRESARVSRLIQEHTPEGEGNWTGEERIQDAMLQTLVEKYSTSP